MPSTIPLERESLIRYFREIGERAGELPEFLNPLFSGRDSELALLHENVRIAASGSLANRTVVVHGAPGAGKSELMAQFLSQLRERESPIVPVTGGDPDVGDAAILMNHLLSELPVGLTRRRSVKRIVNELGKLDSVPVAGTEISRIKHESQPESNAQYEQFRWFRAQVEKLPSKVRDTVFVLCVDEFQNLANPKQSLCRFLHRGDTGLKIVPIYFGLADSPDVLRSAGVSRILDENSLSLGSLKVEDAEAILQAFCDGVRIRFPTESNRDSVVADVSAKCDYWPHHLSSWMRAACDVLPTHEFDMTSEALKKINEICTRYCRNYYRDRVRGPYALESESGFHAFGELVHYRTVIGKGEINRALMPAIERDLLEFDIDQFIAEAIHFGVLERVETAKFRVPIPSLADYIHEASRPFT